MVIYPTTEGNDLAVTTTSGKDFAEQDEEQPVDAKLRPSNLDVIEKTYVRPLRQSSGTFLLPDGYGGGGWNKVLSATQQDNILQIEVGIGGPDNPEEPTIKGILSVELGEGTFRYLSYKLTQHPKGIQ